MTPLENERRRQTHYKLWTNVAAACRSRNTRKGNRTPEEARMPLLYVPYAMCRNEGFILSNRRILAVHPESCRRH